MFFNYTVLFKINLYCPTAGKKPLQVPKVISVKSQDRYFIDNR